MNPPSRITNPGASPRLVPVIQRNVSTDIPAGDLPVLAADQILLGFEGREAVGSPGSRSFTTPPACGDGSGDCGADEVSYGNRYQSWTPRLLRAAYNYHTENIRTVGGSSGGDRYRGDRYYVDLQASYKISDNYILYANWKNVTDEPNELYEGTSAQLRNAEIYGSEIRAGVRFTF